MFYCTLLFELFGNIEPLILVLQKKSMDVGSALQCSQNCLLTLEVMKDDFVFNEMYDKTYAFCEKEEFDLPDSRNLNSKRLRSNTLHNKDFYKTTFHKIITEFINEIKYRFDANHLQSLTEMYKIIMCVDTTNLQIDKKSLELYKDVLNVEKAIRNAKTFCVIKNRESDINWHDFDVTIEQFSKRNLKSHFCELHKLIRIYLSVPVGTAHPERTFSCLKLLKTWLRSTMTTDRLSDMALIKMSPNFNYDFDEIVEQFASLSNRKLDLN